MAAHKRDRHGFARRLAGLREERNLTQVQLGKMVGVTGTCVWNWEGANTFPRPAALDRLAQVLGTSAEYLSCGAEAAPTKADKRSGRRPLAEIIAEARETVAQAAGVPVTKVRIVLDIGD